MTDPRTRGAGESILERAAPALAAAGFEATKLGTWTREREHVIEFVRAERIAAQRAFRIVSGLRVLNDPARELAANGPDSERHRGRGRDFELGFGLERATQDACLAEILRFCLATAEPWFVAHRAASTLRRALSPAERAALDDSLRQGPEPARAAWSRRLLGG